MHTVLLYSLMFDSAPEKSVFKKQALVLVMSIFNRAVNDQV